jgi:serine/threonine protein kinase/tetratricopeptide (TPR) repeat protein
VLEKLGEGGMGVVYKALDLTLARHVALKFLPHDFTRDSEAKKRFMHEAQAASALDHPNICTVHEIGEDESGRMFICMGYYEGKSLKEIIDGGTLESEGAAKIAIQIAEGLAEAHQKGIVHRDIKPANILITNSGGVKIVDFGLAKLHGQTKLTKMGSTVGTAVYMSPEQARGEEVDHRTDIWSLGVILYEMLTGKNPFESEHEQAVIYRILNEEPKPMGGVEAPATAALSKIVEGALQKNTQDRYSSMADMADDLRALIDRKTPSPVGEKPPRGKRPLVRRILVAASVLVVSTLAIILLFTSETTAFTERDWLLVTDFENLTGDVLFDRSLNTAFSVSIEQSTYVNVYSRRRMVETLRRMKKPDVGHIDEELGREIALRDGLRVILIPSISRSGDTYALTGSLFDVEENKSLGSKIVYASGEDKVLDALDKLSKEIRLDLGESLSSVRQKGKPLTQVTTESLEALKQYSLAVENHWNANIQDARDHYEGALNLDSTFTAAKASLGILLLERFPRERERGTRLVSEAVANVDSLTDKEKFGILAFHAAGVEHDLEKAAQYMKSLLALYPDNYTARNNLGWYYQSMGRYNDALIEYKAALRTNPDLMMTTLGVIYIYTNNLPNLDSAISWGDSYIATGGENPWAYDLLGWAHLGRDSLDRAAQAFTKALELNPRSTLDLYRLAHTYRLMGQPGEALQPLERILQVDPSDVSAEYDLGVNYQLLGQDQEAIQHFQTFRREAEKWVQEDPQDGSNYIALAAVLTRLGNASQGWNTGRLGIRKDTTLHFEHAQLLSLQGRTTEALEHLEKAVDNGFTNFTWMKIHPDLQALYNDARFQRIIRRGLNENH